MTRRAATGSGSPQGRFRLDREAPLWQILQAALVTGSRLLGTYWDSSVRGSPFGEVGYTVPDAARAGCRVGKLGKPPPGEPQFACP